MSGRFGGLLGPCPCGSGTAYGACCGPVHDGDPASTAEALMRSRYSAFALGRADHLVRSWHPRTRPECVGVDPATEWLGLDVVRTEAGTESDDTGLVEFCAVYRDDGGRHELREVSSFERRRGRWVYVAAQTK